MDFVKEEDERICRYCLDDDEDDGELISPCACSGGQKYVHLKCLRRWQRMVLVSQPTHPAFYEDDVRHHKCNVCLQEYTCAPPTRGELMESFTGPEIAALLMVDRIICSRDIFSDALEEQVAGMSPMMRQFSSYEHWIKGAYLIYSVEQDKADITLPLSEQSSVAALRSKLNDKLEITLEGKCYRVVAEKSLSYVNTSTNSSSSIDGVSIQAIDRTEALSKALRSLQAPAEVVLSCTSPITSADDSIAAVNLQRQIRSPVRQRVFERIVDKVAVQYPRVRGVPIQHFLGGPVEPEEIGTCIVTGSGRGWTYVKTLEKALLLSLSRRSSKKYGSAQGPFGCGQTVKIVGLQGRKDLNGHYGMTARFVPAPTVTVKHDSVVDIGSQSTSATEATPIETSAAATPSGGRWEVLLCSGEGVRVKPTNLEATSAPLASQLPLPLAAAGEEGEKKEVKKKKGNETEGENGEGEGPGRVLVFWGVARWTRAQLLGEIARGHWGLCRATVQELILNPSSVWSGLTQDQGRLVYAPPSDMTDELVSSGEAQREMEAVRRVAQLSSSPSGVGGEGGEGGDNDDDPLREEVEEVEEMQASL